MESETESPEGAEEEAEEGVTSGGEMAEEGEEGEVADVPEGEDVAEEDGATEEKPAADQGKRLRRMRRRF